jgi:hypothetical protein
VNLQLKCKECTFVQLKCKECTVAQWRENIGEDPCKECIGKTLCLSVEEVSEEMNARSV